MEADGLGYRGRVIIDGENYYITVTDGDEGFRVTITCPRENSPENTKLRTMMEQISTNINMLSRRIREDKSLANN